MLTDYRRTVRLAVVPASHRRAHPDARPPRTFEVKVYSWRAVVHTYRACRARGTHRQDLRAITYFALDTAAAEVAA